MTKLNDYIAQALIETELDNPVQNIIDLTDQMFEVIDNFDNRATSFDIKKALGKFKKYHDFNKKMYDKIK